MLGGIAWCQRALEQLYGEVTGQPSWRVEIITKEGKRLGNGARSGTRGEAEKYSTEFAASDKLGVGDEYASGEVIPCQDVAHVTVEPGVSRLPARRLRIAELASSDWRGGCVVNSPRP